MELKNKKILLTGGGGFLGSAVLQELITKGVKKTNITIPRKQKFDLRDPQVAKKLVKGKDIVIHLAANVGGIGYNQQKPGELFYENAVMGIHLIEEARKAGVKKFVALGTVCAYPKFVQGAFKESALWEGYPEETNAPYGLAKKMLLVQLQAYRAQYGFNGIYLLPVNLYGPNDNFDPKSSHVIPALIKKVYDAKKKNAPFIEAWGTGKATREFLYVQDAARAIVLATMRYEKSDPVNLGSNMEISIKNLITLICKLMDYKGKIKWDKTKPDGQPHRHLDVSRAKKEFGFRAQITFEQGLKETIRWYEQHAI